MCVSRLKEVLKNVRDTDKTENNVRATSVLSSHPSLLRRI